MELVTLVHLKAVTLVHLKAVTLVHLSLQIFVVMGEPRKLQTPQHYS